MNDLWYLKYLLVAIAPLFMVGLLVGSLTEHRTVKTILSVTTSLWTIHTHHSMRPGDGRIVHEIQRGVDERGTEGFLLLEKGITKIGFIPMTAVILVSYK